MSDKVPETDKAPKHQPGEGIRSMRSTTLFRAVNFELYAKPVSKLQFNSVANSPQLIESKAFN